MELEIGKLNHYKTCMCNNKKLSLYVPVVRWLFRRLKISNSLQCQRWFNIYDIPHAKRFVKWHINVAASEAIWWESW